MVDISAGATLTIPDAGARYVSVMVINQDHYINRVLHQPGVHELTVDEFDTPYVLVGARILVDPADPADVAEVNALQDQFQLQAASGATFTAPEYDQPSLDATRTALLELAKGIGSLANAFGAKQDVNPRASPDRLRRRMGRTSRSRGQLRQRKPEPSGRRVPAHRAGRRTGRRILVDLALQPDEYFVPNDRDAVSVNNLTSTPNPDGTVTVHFGGCDDNRPNCLPIMDGWNYLVRLYRPRPEVLNGRWTFPPQSPEPTRSSDPVTTLCPRGGESTQGRTMSMGQSGASTCRDGKRDGNSLARPAPAGAIHPDHLNG